MLVAMKKNKTTATEHKYSIHGTAVYVNDMIVPLHQVHFNSSPCLVLLERNFQSRHTHLFQCASVDRANKWPRVCHLYQMIHVTSTHDAHYHSAPLCLPCYIWHGVPASTSHAYFPTLINEYLVLVLKAAVAALYEVRHVLVKPSP